MTRRPVEQRDIHSDAPKTAGAEQAAETATDDDDLGASVPTSNRSRWF
jgi:hypothetical protein